MGRPLSDARAVFIARPVARHPSPGLTLAAVVLGLGWMAMSLGATGQSVLLVAAVIVGLPHGALDHRVGRAVFEPRYGRRWSIPFLAGYLGLAALVLAAWWALPTVALGVFLGLSLMHFGAEDNSIAGPYRLAGQVAHGGLPIVVTVLAHPVEVERLFALLTNDAGAAMLVAIVSGPITIVWIGAWVVTARAWLSRLDDEGALSAAMEAAALVALFVAVPPLVAFSIYFVAVHTPRALSGILSQPNGQARSGARAISGGFTFTLLAVIAGAALWSVLPQGDPAAAMVRATFILLSALTVPHMWLAWRHDAVPCP